MAYDLLMKKFHKELEGDYLPVLSSRALLGSCNLIGDTDADLIILHHSASDIPVTLRLRCCKCSKSLNIVFSPIPVLFTFDLKAPIDICSR